MLNPAEEILIMRILSVLEGKQLSAVEIAREIQSKFNKHESSYEVYKLIKNELIPDSVRLDKETEKYALINKKEEKQIVALPPNFELLDSKYVRRDYLLTQKTIEQRKTTYKPELINLAKEIAELMPGCASSFQKCSQNEQKEILEIIEDSFRYQLERFFLNFEEDQDSIELVVDINGEDVDEKDAVDLKLPEGSELRDSLVFPLKFQLIPTIDQFRNNYSKYQQLLIKFNNESELISADNLDEILIAIDQKLNSIDEAAIVFWLLHFYYKSKENLTESENLIYLRKILANPLKNFFKLVDKNVERISFAEENPGFHQIIKEIGRDNVITENEREFILEKAYEYLVDLTKLEEYLSNPFIGFETFKLLIDQICEDGVVTPIERTYIQEKAIQYNVPQSVLDEMISVGLLRANFIHGLSEIPNFHNIALSFLLAHAFDIKTVVREMFRVMRKLHDEKTTFDEIENLDHLLFNDIRIYLIRETSHFSDTKSIQDVYSAFNVVTPEYEASVDLFRSQNEFEKVNNDSLWQINLSSSSEIKNNIEFNYEKKEVVIRSNHEEKGKESFQRFITNLMKERDNHRSPEIDLFFENFEDFYD